MPKERNHFDEPIPPKAVCFKCNRKDRPLQRCCLTGSGDHPRRFILCEQCIKDILARSPTVELSEPSVRLAMSETEKRQETRRQKAFDRLGTDHPICSCCPEDDWCCMELHHLEGKDFGKTLVIVCRNCHRKLSRAQKDHSPKFGEPPTTIESIGHFLDGLADWLVLLAQQLREFAAYLIEHARLEGTKKAPARS